MAGEMYFAVNEIRHGEGVDGDGNPNVRVFMPGEQVTGLDVETMKSLWNAGVLTQVDPTARPADDRDARIRELEAQVNQLKAEAEAAAATADETEAAAKRTAEEIPGAGSMFTATNATAARDLEGTKATEGSAGEPVEDDEEPTE
jgi:hypothetical protein